MISSYFTVLREDASGLGGEVTGHSDRIRRAAQVRVNPVRATSILASHPLYLLTTLSWQLLPHADIWTAGIQRGAESRGGKRSCWAFSLLENVLYCVLEGWDWNYVFGFLKVFLARSGSSILMVLWVKKN